MIRHVMVDLETWGISPGSVIVSIGAVVFDPFSYGFDGSFHQAIDPQSAMDAGLTVDASTIKWWLQQSPEAWAGCALDPEHIAAVLDNFSQFVRPWSPALTSPSSWDIRLWCKGPSFDAVLLERAYAACNLPVPFRYNEPRDVRTIVEVADFDEWTLTFAGTQHNALDDAVHQARVVQAAYQKLRTNK